MPSTCLTRDKQSIECSRSQWPRPLAQVLFRKGGIREPTFRPQCRQFLLFPTAFHTEERVIREEYKAVLSPVRP